MKPYITDAERTKLPREGEHLVLAIVLLSGEVRFRIADPILYPGHMEWLRRDHLLIDDTLAGFSVIIKAGVVTHLFTASRLNRFPYAELDPAIARRLRTLLSFAEDAQV